jgi:hypothetical protein
VTTPGCLISGFLPENPGVLKMDTIAEIRRLHFVENISIRELAKTFKRGKRPPSFASFIRKGRLNFPASKC